jgi:hypothetical protein
MSDSCEGRIFEIDQQELLNFQRSHKFEPFFDKKINSLAINRFLLGWKQVCRSIDQPLNKILCICLIHFYYSVY